MKAKKDLNALFEIKNSFIGLNYADIFTITYQHNIQHFFFKECIKNGDEKKLG